MKQRRSLSVLTLFRSCNSSPNLNSRESPSSKANLLHDKAEQRRTLEKATTPAEYLYHMSMGLSVYS